MVIWKLCSHSSAKIGFHFLNSAFWESVLKNLKLAWNRLRAQAVVLLSILFQPSGARITALCHCAQGDTLIVYGKRSETVRSLCKHANVRHTDIQTPAVCKGMTPYLHNAFVCLALFIAHMCLFLCVGLICMGAGRGQRSVSDPPTLGLQMCIFWHEYWNWPLSLGKKSTLNHWAMPPAPEYF